MKTELQKFEVMIPAADGQRVADHVEIEIPVVWDEDLAQWLLTPEAHEQIEETKARYMGLLAPSQLRELRGCLGLTQKEISALLQLGEKTWTRWESGRERPSRSMNILLHALYDGRIDINYLTLLQNPSQRPASVPRPEIFRTVYARGFTAELAADYPDAALAA